MGPELTWGHPGLGKGSLPQGVVGDAGRYGGLGLGRYRGPAVGSCIHWEGRLSARVGVESAWGSWGEWRKSETVATEGGRRNIVKQSGIANRPAHPESMNWSDLPGVGEECPAQRRPY